MNDISGCENLGAGIGLRKEHFRELTGGSPAAVSGRAPSNHFLASPGSVTLPADAVGWLEIVPENFMNFGGFPRTVLEHCAARWPVVSHGVNLSIGSVDPLNEEYLERLSAVLAATKARWFSDHLCFTSIGGDYFHDLLPLPFTHEAADHVVARVKTLKKRSHLPFLLENPSYYVQVPGAQMDEAAFFTKVLAGADCGLLLDVNNVYVNSRNHGFDARDFIRRLPLERVGQIHMAGHKDCGDVIVDTHEGPIIDPVWELYRFTLEAIGRPVSTLIEWDTNVPPLAAVVAEAGCARDVMEDMGWRAPAAKARGVAPEFVEVAGRSLAQRREAVGAPAQARGDGDRSVTVNV